MLFLSQHYVGFSLLVIWSLAWKAAGLWRAGRNSSKGWFAAIFLLNTAGILEILYLYVFSGKRPLVK